jgi:hypothetical protein
VPENLKTGSWPSNDEHKELIEVKTGEVFTSCPGSTRT